MNVLPPFIFKYFCLIITTPSHPALMLYVPALSLSGTHQEALAFTLQKICGHVCPAPGVNRVKMMVIQCV